MKIGRNNALNSANKQCAIESVLKMLKLIVRHCVYLKDEVMQKSRMFKLAVSLLLLFLNSNALASAYYLYNAYSAVAAGDAGAGGAALAEDATTIYANPAGMSRLTHPQLVISGSVLDTSVNFEGTNTWSSPGLGEYVQSGKAEGGATRFFPELYYSYPVNQKWNVGVSVTVPFGLGTYYPIHSVVRYSATTSELKVIDLSPNIAYKLNNQWSFGAGIDIDYSNIRLRAMAGVPTISTSLDSLSKNIAYGWGCGWHAGILYEFTPDTRFGFSYRSKMTNRLEGNSFIEGGAIDLLSGGITRVASNSDLKMTLVLPPISTLSAYHAFNSTWAIDGTLTYLQWRDLPNHFDVDNIASYPSNISGYLPEDYQNSWIAAFGGIYHPISSWLMRAGIFWDQTPIKANDLRTANLPDSSRTGLSIGTHYQATKTLGVDLGWTHEFFNTAAMNTDLIFGIQTSNTHGTFHNHLDIISASLTWDVV
jgi:long-chain fatty acid transport protein